MGQEHDAWVSSVLGVQLPPRSGAAAPGGGAPGAAPPGGAPLGGVRGLLDTSSIGSDMFAVGDYLRRHQLMTIRENLMLDANTMTVDEVVRKVISDLHLRSTVALVTSWVQDEASRAPDFLTMGQGGAQGGGGGGGPAPTMSLSYAFVPVTAHVDLHTGQGSTDAPQHQASFAGTLALHADGHAGLELAWQVQVAADASNFQVASILQGLQAAWVIPFLNGALQISALATAAAGASRGETSPSGQVTMRPTSQVGAGGQVTYAIPGTGGNLMIGFQVAASVTAQQGANPTADFAPQGFLQIQWH